MIYVHGASGAGDEKGSLLFRLPCAVMRLTAQGKRKWGVMQVSSVKLFWFKIFSMLIACRFSVPSPMVFVNPF